MILLSCSKLRQEHTIEEIPFCTLIPKPVLVISVPGLSRGDRQLFSKQNCPWLALECSSKCGKCSELQLYSFCLCDSPAPHIHDLKFNTWLLWSFHLSNWPLLLRLKNLMTTLQMLYFVHFPYHPSASPSSTAFGINPESDRFLPCATSTLGQDSIISSRQLQRFLTLFSHPDHLHSSSVTFLKDTSDSITSVYKPLQGPP